MSTPRSRYLFLASAIALGLVGCGGQQQEPAKSEARVVQARAEVVGMVEIPAYHTAPAVVVADERAEVASRLMGHIRDIAVAEGQRVARGQYLFTVDPVDVAGQAEVARLAVTQAESDHADAKAELDRFANLFKEEVVSRQQFDKIKLRHDTAAARLAQAKAGLATAAGQLGYARVAAPITGVVTRKLANVGDMATPGQPVLVLENPERLQVETQVPANVMATLKPGQAAQVEIDGRLLAAKVARLSPAADPVSHTFMVRLAVAEAGLSSGGFARALFPMASRQALRVPKSALVNRAGIEGVFVLDKEGIAQFRMIRSGEASDGAIEVLAGLEPGERIVVEGAAALESGDKVRG